MFFKKKENPASLAQRGGSGLPGHPGSICSGAGFSLVRRLSDRFGLGNMRPLLLGVPLSSLLGQSDLSEGLFADTMLRSRNTLSADRVWALPLLSLSGTFLGITRGANRAPPFSFHYTGRLSNITPTFFLFNFTKIY